MFLVVDLDINVGYFCKFELILHIGLLNVVNHHEIYEVVPLFGRDQFLFADEEDQENHLGNISVVLFLLAVE